MRFILHLDHALRQAVNVGAYEKENKTRGKPKIKNICM